MNKHSTFYTSQHRRLLDTISNTLMNEPWLVLNGKRGAGKSVLVQGVVAAWPHRAVTIGLLLRKGYLQEWIVLADTQLTNNLAGRVFSFSSLWSELLCLIGGMHHSVPLFVLEYDQRAGNGIISTVKAFFTMMPKARLLLVGTFPHRQQRHLRTLYPVWFEIPRPNVDDCRKVIATHAAIEPEQSGVLSDLFVRRVMHRCCGNLHLVARSGGFIRRNMEGEKQAAVEPVLQQAALRYLPAKPKVGGVCLALIVVAALFGWVGRYFYQPLSQWLPQKESLLSIATSRSASSPLTLTSEIMSTNESLSLLYSVWGFSVNKGEAWCDQAYRAGMACLFGNYTLETLLQQGLPWISTLNMDGILVPVVIIGDGGGALTLLSGSQTWIVDKSWFSSVWTRTSTILWKPSPDGEAVITKNSSPDDIAWLDTALSRALNVESEVLSEWSPLLSEKVRQFQIQQKIKADGVMGQLSLIRLWQVLGESPKLNKYEEKV